MESTHYERSTVDSEVYREFSIVSAIASPLR